MDLIRCGPRSGPRRHGSSRTRCSGSLGVYRSEYVERSSFRAEAQAQELRDALAARNAELHRLSHLDALTGIANRRGFETALAQSAQSAGCAVLMIDVDHFKRYNDHYGHPTGDRWLTEVAEILLGHSRYGPASNHDPRRLALDSLTE